ncbi:MAG TPA: amino acid adenylation domain-containing protein [Longimicrobium sp.]
MDRRNVEDVYPLSPLQHGLLFHAVLRQGAYWEQFPLLLHGPVDADALERAFRGVVARHPALRTGFVWENVAQPLQVVYRVAEPPVSRHDWTRAAQWRAELAALLDANRAAARDLKRAPLVRLDLARVGAEETVMLLGFHHLVMDGWSFPIVVDELIRLYRAEITHHPAQLPPAPRYRAYVAWLQARDASADERFWRAALDGFAEPTPLPLDGSGAGAGGDEQALETLVVGDEASARMAAVARELGVTPATLAQAAWSLVLARFAGADDVAFGTTISGRPPELAEVGGMVGLFINTIPARVRLDAGARLGEWLRGIHRAQAEAREHGYASLVDVQGWSAVPRDRSLFESLLVFENYPTPADDDVGPRVSPLPSAERSTYALTLTCGPGPHGFELRLAYETARFDAVAARRILAATAAALDAVRGAADARVGDLSVLTAADRKRLDAWSRGPALAVTDAPVHARVAAQAAHTPDAVAVDALDGALTYTRLEARAQAVAAALRARGVGRGALVAVCLERGADLPAALLGVMKAGAAYVPIDPSYPAERVRWMLEDSAAAVVVTTPAIAETLPETGAEVMAIDGIVPAPDLHLPQVDGDDVAYVVYTSGTTGRPKGAAIPHRALANHCAWMQDAFPLGPGDRVLQKTPVSFDASVWEFWAPLVAGATLVMGGPDAHRDPAALARETAERGITVLQLVPALLRAVVDEPAFARATRLRRLFAGGEALPADLARRAADLHPRAEIVNLYGPAEACIDAAAHRFGGDGGAMVPLGRPISNLRAYVLDGALSPVPPGAPGELYLSGPALARGYLHRPARTAASFLPDPFAEAPGARMYRTGDVARWTEVRECESAKVREGDDSTFAPSHPRTFALDFLGRADAQVKLRGVRIEPGEVEAALAALPGVREAAVALRGERLVAWVAGDEDAVAADALARALRARLPEAMVPSVFATVDALPRTAGGKIDRRALPDPAPAAAAEFVEPRTETERAIAEIWRQVLGIDRVGAEDSFFAAGGHSLLAMQVASRVKAALETDVPLRVLFDHPRLCDLAAWIDAQREAELQALLAELDAMSDEEAAALADVGEG